MRFKTVVYWCLMFLSVQAKAQVRFYASAEKNVPLNYQLQVSFTLENGDGKNFTPPSFSDWQVVNGPSISNSVQIINNSYSKSQSYTYVLKPKREGTARIGKASIQVAGSVMESAEISVEVGKPAQQQRQNRQRNPYQMWDPFADPFEEEEPEPAVSQGDVEKQIRDNVFMKMIVDKSSVFLGEQLTATLRLYYRLNFGQTQLSKAPSFDGFWSQEVSFPQNQNPRGVETINGVQYHTIDVQKFNLFPQRSGDLSISAAEMDMIVQVQMQRKSRSMWDDFFGNARVQNLTYKARSGEVKINVKEPPLAGRPEGFSGAVGQIDVRASVSSENGKVDEPITYSVKISGKGNLKTISIDKPEVPAGFEVYEPKIKENLSNTGAGLSGTIQYDFLLIPRQPGTYKIPARKFSWFNPQTKTYGVSELKEFSLVITGTPSQVALGNSGGIASKEEVKTLGQDIRYLKIAAGEPIAEQRNFARSPMFWTLYSGPIALFLLLTAVKRRNTQLQSDLIGSRRRKANKMALKRLAQAKKHWQAGEIKLFYDELTRSLWGYTADKLNLDVSVLNKDNLADKLAEKRVAPEQIQELLSLISEAEFALFAPGAGSGTMQAHYEKAYGLISKLEDVLAA